jgi:hypothetical protein
MSIEDKKNKVEDYYKSSQLPWYGVIFIYLLQFVFVILVIYGLVKLVKFFWLL